MNKEKQLIGWLNDAYGMECSVTKVLENHANDAKDYPDVRARQEQHLAETRRHAELVEKCLGFLGEKPAATKGIMGAAFGKVQGAASGMFSDEMVKNMLSDYAAEHLEIASYTSLIAAAEEVGQAQIATICNEILKEEEAMAEWLAEAIPAVTKAYMMRT